MDTKIALEKLVENSDHELRESVYLSYNAGALLRNDLDEQFEKYGIDLKGRLSTLADYLTDFLDSVNDALYIINQWYHQVNEEYDYELTKPTPHGLYTDKEIEAIEELNISWMESVIKTHQTLSNHHRNKINKESFIKEDLINFIKAYILGFGEEPDNFMHKIRFLDKPIIYS